MRNLVFCLVLLSFVGIVRAEEGSSSDQTSQQMSQSAAILTGGTTGETRKIPFGGTVILEQSLGVGTFVADQYARTPYYSWLLSIRPRYYITKQLFAELRFDLSQELTTSYGTTTTKKYQVMPSDTLLTVKYSNLYTIPKAKINFSPFIRITAPTSYESAYRDLYLALALGFDLTRTFGPIFLDYTIRASKSFNKYTVATVKVDKSKPVAVARVKGNEELAGNLIATGSNNVEWSLYNSILGSWMINDKWSVSLWFAILNSWTYNSYPKDEYSAPQAKAGRGQRDYVFSQIDVTFQPWAYVGFSAGISTAYLPPKTQDNRSFRFPFFDYSSPANNYTTFYLDVFATY